MKIFKKLQALALAAIMAVVGFSTTAFAAEVEPSAEDQQVVVDFDITPDMVDENGMIAIPVSTRSLVDQTFYFTNYHRGADRTYYKSSLQFSITITDSNGNCTGDKVSVQLKDYYGNIQYYTAYANGSTYGFNTSIVYGRTYYFYYDNVSSSTRELKVHMVIN